MVQLLPFADEKCIDIIEENVNKMPPVSKLLDDGTSPEEIAGMLLKGLDPNELDTASPEYHCDCSRERTERILLSIGEEELSDIAAEEKDTEVCCHFCGRKYVFTPNEIRKLMGSLRKES